MPNLLAAHALTGVGKTTAQGSLDDMRKNIFTKIQVEGDTCHPNYEALHRLWLHFVHIVDAQVTLQLCGWLLVVPSPQLWMDEEIILSTTNLPAQ